MSTPVSSLKSTKENIKLRAVFWSSSDNRYVLCPLQELGMKTVDDVIECHNNKQNWQALEKKIKESAETEAALKIFDKKIATMIQHFEAGGDSFQKWVQERRNGEMHYELQMKAFHNQLNYLMQMLGLDEIYAVLIEQRFGIFDMSDLSQLANQNIFEKLQDKQLRERVYLALDFCNVCLTSSNTRLNELEKTIWTESNSKFIFDVETKTVFESELDSKIYYLSRLRLFVSDRMPKDYSVNCAVAPATEAERDAGAAREADAECVTDDSAFELFVKKIGLQTKLVEPIITEMKRQGVKSNNNIENVSWWMFDAGKKESVRHVCTLYSMCKHASLPSLRDQSKTTKRFFTSKEITEIERHIAERQERLLDLRVYVQSIKCGGAAGGDENNFGFLLFEMDAGGAAGGAASGAASGEKRTFSNM